MKAKFKILAVEFKKESYKFIYNNCAWSTEPLMPIGEFKRLEFNYKFLIIIYPLQVGKNDYDNSVEIDMKALSD